MLKVISNAFNEWRRRAMKKPVDYISKVKVIGLKMLRPNGKTANIPVRLSSREFVTLQKMEITLPDDKAETRQ